MNWDSIRYFRESEFACKGAACCGGQSPMDLAFVRKLDNLRDLYDAPLRISSGYRCPIHNQRVSSTGASGPHTTGLAVDIAIDRADAHKLLELACKMGFAGYGINQKGNAGRFLHLDDLTEGRPTTWTY